MLIAEKARVVICDVYAFDVTSLQRAKSWFRRFAKDKTYAEVFAMVNPKQPADKTTDCMFFEQ